MAQEDKELLLKDLCVRLPYGVKVHLSRKHNRPEEDIVLNNVIINKDGFVVSNIIGYNYLLSEIKPYLRPMSSMTEEERQIEISYKRDITTQGWGAVKLYMNQYIEWLDSNHFDWRTDGNNKTLIERGLALVAPEGMYNLKDK